MYNMQQSNILRGGHFDRMTFGYKEISNMLVLLHFQRTKA